MSVAVFREYDQETLDWEYDCRRKTPDTDVCKAAQFKASDEAKASYERLLDVRFGDGETDSLDIYIGQGQRPSPVHVFFHGGYWKSNTKDDFGFVAKPFVPYGVNTVVVEYPLIPVVRMETLIDRCRAALDWVWRNAATFGGDRDRITVSGHSAGGHVVSMMLQTDWPSYAADLPGDVIKAGCAISGLYDLVPVRICSQNDDLSLTEEEVAVFSPVLEDPLHSGPLLLAVGGDEGPEFIRQTEDLARAWSGKGMKVESWVMPGKHHFTTINEYLDPESGLSQRVRALAKP